MARRNKMSSMNMCQIFLILFLLPGIHTSANDPEVLQQLWNQLYRFMPTPSLPPQLPADLSINVEVSVSLDSVELKQTDGGLHCLVSFTMLSEWPVTDARVADSRLLELINGGVRLEAQRVWHPEVTFVGSHGLQRLTKRLELRTKKYFAEVVSNGSPLARPNAVASGSSVAIGRQTHIYTKAEASLDTSVRGNNRRDPGKIAGGNDGPHYVMIESFAVEISCSKSRKFSHLGGVLCPIWLRQEGSAKIQPGIKWADRHGCLLSSEVIRGTSYVSLTKRYGEYLDKQGSDHSLVINLCFSQTKSALYSSLLPLVIACISILLLWNEPLGINEPAWLQLLLLVFMSACWRWFIDRQQRSDGSPGPEEVWCLICFTSVAIANGLAVARLRWVSQVLRRQRKRYITRAPSLSLLQNKTAGGGVIGPTGMTGNIPTAGCFQGCACGSSAGTCPDSCVNCSTAQGCSGGSFASPSNGPNRGYCSNSSCGAPGHVCVIGSAGGNAGNLPGSNTANNSPAPLGFTPQTIGIGCNKMDGYIDGYLCSANSDSGNGGVGGTFRALRWRSNGLGRRVIGFDPPECQACSCPFSLPHIANQSGSPAPPYTSVSSADRSTRVPTHYCITVIRITVTILFFLVSAIFWISILAQGTVPESCLGASLCRPVNADSST